MELLWWHWMLVALVAFILELMAPAFFMLWFAIAAVIVSVVTWLAPIPVWGQLLLWAGSTTVVAVLWKRYFKVQTKSLAGQASEVIGITGVITNRVTPDEPGEIMFQRPVLGADRWKVYSEETIEAGTKAAICKVTGQLIYVKGV